MNTIPRTAVLLCLLVAPLAHGAEPVSPGRETPTDQVVIEATRANLVKLGKEVVESEGRFYQRYNELNTKRDYEVRCYNEARVGTLLKRRSCQPVYQSKAEEAEAREFILALGRNNAPSGVPSEGLPTNPAVAIGGSTPASMAIEAGRPGFKKNMIEVTQRNPDLQKLAREHAELVKRWEDVFFKVNGRPVIQDKAASPAVPVPPEAPAKAQ